MSGNGSLMKLKTFLKKFLNKNRYKQVDTVELNLPGLNIKISRNMFSDTPHEVTVVVPRAEMRKTCHYDDCSNCEWELIYSSITVVHAPRHTLAGPSNSTSEEIPNGF